MKRQLAVSVLFLTPLLHGQQALQGSRRGTSQDLRLVAVPANEAPLVGTNLGAGASAFVREELVFEVTVEPGSFGSHDLALVPQP